MMEIDGTENKSKLGANAILGVSLAVCSAGAAAKGAYVRYSMSYMHSAGAWYTNETNLGDQD